MKKKKSKNKEKKKQKRLILEKQYEETKRKRQEVENDINNMLDDLSVEELTEIETIGNFSKEAIEWIRTRKKRKKAKKAQEEFEKRLRCSDEVIRRTVLIGKIEGFRNGSYIPKSKKEATELMKEIEQDIEREERIREKETGDTRNSKSGGRSRDERDR